MENKPYNLVEENDFEKMEEAARRAIEAAKAPTFSETEYNTAKQEAYERGKSDGMREALTNQEERIAQALELLTVKFDELISKQSAYEVVQQKQAVHLAINMLKKVMPKFVETQGVNEIQQVMKKALDNNLKETQLIVYVNHVVLMDVQKRIEQLAKDNGYNRVSVQTDDMLGPSDVRIEWGNGGLERIVDHLWSEIETHVTRFLNGEDIQDYLSATSFDKEEEKEPEVKSEEIETTSEDQPVIGEEEQGITQGENNE